MLDFEALMKEKPSGRMENTAVRTTLEARAAIVCAVLTSSHAGKSITKSELKSLPECSEKTAVGDVIGKGKGGSGLDLDLIKKGKETRITPGLWQTAKALDWLVRKVPDTALEVSVRLGFDGFEAFQEFLVREIQEARNRVGSNTQSANSTISQTDESAIDSDEEFEGFNDLMAKLDAMEEGEEEVTEKAGTV